MTRAYVALGSNIGAENNVLAAVRLIAGRARVVGASTFYWTESIPPGAPPFVDGVIALDCDMGPRALKFVVLRRIEAQLGRTRSADPSAPRTIDCDLLLYGDAVVRERDLVLPHPDIETRAFVAVPLLEVAHDRRVPGSGRMLSETAAALDRGAMTPLASLTRAVHDEVRQ